ncbi:hypothetical protein [Actinotalea sp. JY-7876]|uniref:hypothetical protein n=1 Tax=Actinotalea sp. JY-7876 TaxID=2758442 RepID=UPI0015F4A0FD|nr:hypothetical protein [Actinotalea sp. JY-7876]
MHAATEAIGMIASLTSFLLWVPQGVRVWRARRSTHLLSGIALSTQVISLAGSLLWFTYAVLIESFWIGAPLIVNGPIAVMTIVVLLRARRTAAATATAVLAGTAEADEVALAA